MTHYDIVDEYDVPTGSIVDYDTVHRLGLWHRGAHVILYTADGRIVIQKRAADLPTYPNVYEISAGGGVDAGETTEQAAVREVREELGLLLTPAELTYIGKDRMMDKGGPYISNAFLYCYKARIPNDAPFTLDAAETQSVALVGRHEIELAMNNQNVGAFGTLAPRNHLWKLLLGSL